MTGAERGFLLLCCHLGNPQRRPLTVAQFRKLARRVRLADKDTADRDLEPADLMAMGYGSQEARQIIDLFAEEELLDRYLSKAAKLGCVPLTWLTPGYPQRLLEALGDDAPACLWARGDLSLLEKESVSLVGSRDLYPENEAFARDVGREAARQDLVLVSGNARGADRVGQNGALAAGGQVISIVADALSGHSPKANVLYLSEDGFDLEFSAQRAISRNRCIHAMSDAAIAAQCSLRTGGTWDGSVKNLRFVWSTLYVFEDESESAQLLEQMGAVAIDFDDLKDLRNLPKPTQTMI